MNIDIRLNISDPDFNEALPVVFVLLARCLGRFSHRSEIKRFIEDELRDSEVAAGLSEPQMHLVWRLCELALDSMDTPKDDQ